MTAALDRFAERGWPFQRDDGLGVVWFDEQRLYRYLWGQVWPDGRDIVTWIMLNPSTADEHQDDATIRRCRDFSKRWGFSTMLIVNLFALRSSRPLALQRADDPVGPLNDLAIEEAAKSAALVVCAWGNHGWWLGRDQIVLDKLRDWGVEPHCLGLTASLRPKHPLRLARETELLSLRDAMLAME